MTMKKFTNLIKIAEPYFGENVPANPFLLCNRLQILCHPLPQDDSRLRNSPAVLYKNKKTIYYDSSAKYAIYYLFHEISHYLLEHSSDGITEEQEANMLACILIAPPKLIPTHFKNANDLASYASLPIGRAEEYWQNLKNKKQHQSECLF